MSDVFDRSAPFDGLTATVWLLSAPNTMAPQFWMSVEDHRPDDPDAVHIATIRYEAVTRRWRQVEP